MENLFDILEVIDNIVDKELLSKIDLKNLSYVKDVCGQINKELIDRKLISDKEIVNYSFNFITGKSYWEIQKDDLTPQNFRIILESNIPISENVWKNYNRLKLMNKILD